MAGRILGMGDVVSLVERAQSSSTRSSPETAEEDARTSSASTTSWSRCSSIKKMGNMKDLLGMVPGMGKAIKGPDIPMMPSRASRPRSAA